MNVYLAVVVVSLLAAWSLEGLAAILSARALAESPAAETREILRDGRLEQAGAYAAARTRLELAASTWGLLLLLAAMFLGAFNWADALVAGLPLPETPRGACFIGLLALAADVAGVPASLYATFVVEERFGFNRTTPGLWLADKVKSWLLALALGGPLCWAVLYFFAALGSWAWLAAWGASVLVLTLVYYLGPVLILPLFYKLTPMEPGGKRDAVLECARKAAVPVADVLVMDGSRRSSKSNAFFTGLGDKRRIVLFDTLVEKHDAEELAAILAHEAGHWKLKHVPLMFGLGALKAGALFWLLSFFMKEPGLHAAFGMDRVTVHGGLVFFMILMTPLSLVLGMLTGRLSRAMEYAADRFAARVAGRADPLVRALVGLGRNNLANPDPHPLDVALHHSHPPLVARIRTLRGLGRDS